MDLVVNPVEALRMWRGRHQMTRVQAYFAFEELFRILRFRLVLQHVGTSLVQTQAGLAATEPDTP
jgi:hypothetical protein